MGLTKEKIEIILERRGYRAVSGEPESGAPVTRDADTAGADPRPASRWAEARSPRIEVLQRQYGQAAIDGITVPRTRATREPARGSRYEGTGAIVTAEPLSGRGRRKAIVLSEDGEILGEQG